MKFTLAILFLFLAKSVSGKQHDPSDHALLADDFPKGGGAFGNNGGKGLRQQHWSAKDGQQFDDALEKFKGASYTVPHNQGERKTNTGVECTYCETDPYPGCDSGCIPSLDWHPLGADIVGEAGGDEFGWSVALSSDDGLTVVIGAPHNDGINGGDAGQVKVLHYNGSDWNQLGADIAGDEAGDHSGRSVAISANGMTVAIRAPDTDGTNGAYSVQVRVFHYNESETDWNQLGSDIVGDAGGDHSGRAVAMSADGLTVAIGAPGYGTYSGHVRVFHYSETETAWNQLGSDIVGDDAGDHFGVSVAMSANGLTVAIGAPNNRDLSGQVKVFHYDGSDWNQWGAAIEGDAVNDWSGSSVALSANGLIIAIGALERNIGIHETGHVRLFHYNESETAWNQLGSDIVGDDAGDWLGYSVALSHDGTIIAVGAPREHGLGYVRVYRLDDAMYSTWDLLGEFDGDAADAADDKFGFSVDISADGSTIAIGATGVNSNTGIVRVFEVPAQPSQVPSDRPSSNPSSQASRYSTYSTSQPSQVPSDRPSSEPSSQPSDRPQPSQVPSDRPSSNPSSQPSSQPSQVPSDRPSSEPSSQPSDRPSSEPSSPAAMTKKTIPVKIEMVLNVTSTVGDSIGADIKQVMEQYVIDGLSDDNEITNVTLAVTLVRRSLLRHLQQTKDITLEVQGSVQYDSTSTEDATAISEELKILLNAENLNQALLNSGVNGVLGVKQATTLVDACPLDPDKTEPGICGCGVADDTAGSALRTCGTTLFPRGSCVVCCDAATNAAGPACCDKVPYDPDASTCCNDTWLFQGDTSADCASASWEPSQVPSSQPSSVSSSNPSSQLSSEPSSQPSSVYGEDVYLIKSLYNEKCVDWDYGDNNNVHVFPCHSESNQFWYMTGDEELKSPFGSECLDYDYGNGNVYMHACTGKNNQKWTYDPTTQQIKSKHGKCLDMNYGDNNNLYMYDCHDGENQKYRFGADICHWSPRLWH